MPRGPRREPPAPKRSRRSGSAAGAGVLRNAPGTGRMGVVAAMLCNGRARALWRAVRHSETLLVRVYDEDLEAWAGWEKQSWRRPAATADAASTSGRNQETVLLRSSRGGGATRIKALGYGAINGMEMRW